MDARNHHDAAAAAGAKRPKKNVAARAALISAPIVALTLPWVPFTQEKTGLDAEADVIVVELDSGWGINGRLSFADTDVIVARVANAARAAGKKCSVARHVRDESGLAAALKDGARAGASLYLVSHGNDGAIGDFLNRETAGRTGAEFRGKFSEIRILSCNSASGNDPIARKVSQAFDTVAYGYDSMVSDGAAALVARFSIAVSALLPWDGVAPVAAGSFTGEPVSPMPWGELRTFRSGRDAE